MVDRVGSEAAQMPAIGFVASFRRNSTAILVGLWYGAWWVLGAWLILQATPWGIGVRHDSLAYLTAADNLAHGQCMCWTGSGDALKPLVHFGPLYPSLVAVVGRFTGDVLEAARWIDAVLYGANLALSGIVVHRVTRRSWASALVSAFLLLSPVILQVHDAAMSEPLFLFVFLLGVLALTAFLDRGRTTALVLSSLATAAAVLTRYAGASFLITAATAVVFLGTGPLRSRIRHALILLGVGVAPVSVWLARNYFVAGTPTNRVFRVHLVDVDDVRLFLDVMAKWVGTKLISHWVEGAVLAALLAGFVVLFWRMRRSLPVGATVAPTTGLVLLLFMVAYSFTIALSKSFFDDSIPIDNRMLSPLWVSFVLIFGIAAGIALHHRRWLWMVVPLGVLVLVGPARHMGREVLRVYRSMQSEGVGFTSRAWRESGSLGWIRALPTGAIVYSNRGLMIQFLTGHAAYQLPEGYDSVKAEARSDFDEQLSRMQSDLRRPDSYLVIFDPVRPVDLSTLPEEFTEGLELFLKTDDGVVFRWPSAGAGS